MPKLGRGLDVLLNQQRLVSSENNHSKQDSGGGVITTTTVDISLLEKGTFQPRNDIDTDSLNNLVHSIKTQGILQPIIVRALKNKYEIIAGERRYQAAKLAKLDKVPVIIKELNNQEALAIALIENIQREALTPLESAFSFEKLVTEFSMTHQEVASVVSQSRSAVSNLIRLLQLDPRVQKLLNHNDIKMGHARALLSLDHNEQFTIANEIIGKHLSVRQTENYIRKYRQPHQPTNTYDLLADNQNIASGITSLSSLLQTKISVKTNKNQQKGKLVINYDSQQQLAEMLAKLQH